MSAEANKAVVQRYLDKLINAGDLSRIDEICAPDYTLYIQGRPPVQGPAELQRVFVGLRASFPDLRVAVDGELVAESDWVALRYTWSGTHQGDLEGIAPTGKHVTWSGIGISRLEAGRIVDDWVVEDHLGLLQQLGVIPELTPTASS
jgi:predicted ester cyclase